MVKGFSRAQIGLHWAVALLIIYQLVFGEDMSHVARAFRNAGTLTMTTGAWIHILIGIAVLVLAIWRLGLRFARGVPAAPADDSALNKLAGEAGHWGLYALMIAAPVSGLLFWYGGIGSMGDIHQLMKPLLIILIGLHVLAALWHQYVRKDGLIARMMRAE